MAPKAPDSNALSGVREGMLEDVERLVRRSRYLEAHAGAAVLHRDHQRVRDTAPQERDLDAVRRAVVKLCVSVVSVMSSPSQLEGLPDTGPTGVSGYGRPPS
jgi:hypothetical protein